VTQTPVPPNDIPFLDLEDVEGGVRFNGHLSEFALMHEDAYEAIAAGEAGDWAEYTPEIVATEGDASDPNNIVNPVPGQPAELRLHCTNVIVAYRVVGHYDADENTPVVKLEMTAHGSVGDEPIPY
jgi:hypothetical protein